MEKKRTFKFEHIEDIITCGALLLMLLSISTNIVMNWIMDKRLSALEELGTGAYMFSVYAGFGLLYKRSSLTRVNFVLDTLPKSVRWFVEMLAHLFVVFFAIVMLNNSIQLCMNSTIKRLPALGISYMWLDLSFVLGFGTMVIRSIINSIRHIAGFKRIVLKGGAEA